MTDAATLSRVRSHRNTWSPRSARAGPRRWFLLAHLKKSTDRTPAPPMLVRVVDYTIDDERTNAETYRLFTTLLDPDEVPATELAAAYHSGGRSSSPSMSS